MQRVRMAVIGVGHLGKEHARILSGMSDVELIGVADVNREQAKAVALRCNTTAFEDYWPLLNLVDAATIVVPTTNHHAIAGEFLRRGIPVLVEKPLALTVAQASELCDIARQQGVPLQVGHIERFNPAFEEVARRTLQPKYVECERVGPFSGRSTDIGVVLDLMIHDIDLLLSLVRSPARTVDGVGLALFGQHEDIANVRISFENGCVANLTASRAAATAARHMRVWAPEGYVGIDFSRRGLKFIQPSEQFRRHGLGARKLEPSVLAMLKTEMFGRHFEVLHLDCNQGDQLTTELQHFVQCVRTGATPRVSGEDGRDAIALATRIIDSIRSHPWEGRADGPTGPTQLPAPLGPLFSHAEDEAAA